MEYPKLHPKGNTILICGHLYNQNYQRAKWIVENIIRKRLFQVFKSPYVCGLYEADFRQQLWCFQHAIGDVFWTSRSEVMVFINGAYIGDDECLRHFLNLNFPVSEIIPGLTSPQILEAGQADFLALVTADTGKRYAYLDIGIDGTYAGSLVIRLYSNIVPRTCEHFLQYVRTTLEEKRDYGIPGYIGTQVHRICSPSFLQAGDIDQYTPIFSDECFDVLHNRRGVVSFSNVGPDTNRCQFIISLNPNPWMDRKYVAFGQIVEGMGVLDQIESIPTYYESPRKNIEILNCGLLPLKPTSEDEVKSHDLISENQIFPDVPSLSFYDIKSVPDESDETFLQRDFKKLIVDHFNQLPLPVLDKVHPSDVPSDHLLLDRYAKGLYSLPKEYQAFVQTTREHSCHPGKTVTVPCQPNAIPGGPSSADPRQYYSLRGSGNPPIYAGLSPEELQGKTDRELLRLFDVPPGLDGISQENMSRLSDDLGRLVMEALSKEIRVTGGSKEGRGNEKEKRRNEDILGDAPSENVLGDDENEESKENVVMVTESKQNEEIQERK